MARALFLTQVDRLERNKDQSIVGRAAPAETESHNSKGAKHIIVLPDDFYCLVRNVGGVGKRSAGRGLNNEEEVVLLFRGQEGGRHVVIKIDRRRQASDKEQQHPITQAQHLLDHFYIENR